MAENRVQLQGVRETGESTNLKSLIRPVSQVTLELTGEGVFAKTRTEILRWMTPRVGRRLPDEAWKGSGFNVEDVGALPVEAVSVEKGDMRLWAGRLDDADKTVARRVWTTEVALGEKSDVTILGVRILCITHGDDPPFERSVPGLVRQVVSRNHAFLGGIPVSVKPLVVDLEDDVDELVGLLTSARRDVDAIVFSVADAPHQAAESTRFSAEYVAERALGTVHVSIIGPDASYRLSDRLGREFSVFGGAVRTYRPRFDPSRDDPFDHPLALARTVTESFERNDKEFHRFLVDHSLRRSVSRHDAEQRLPSHTVIRRFAQQERRDHDRAMAKDDKDLLDVAMEENADLQEQLDRSERESKSLFEVAESERDAAENEAQGLNAKLAYLRERISLLEKERLGERVASIDPVLPDSLSGLRDWAAAQLAGSVEVLNRAIQSAKKSVFSDPKLVYKALLMLRDHYVPMRRRWEGATIERFEAACHELQIEESGAISEVQAGQEGNEYYVAYQGRRILMARHLKKGNSRDERYCLRIYFFWDDENEQVVVGSLPGHLDTRNT